MSRARIQLLRGGVFGGVLLVTLLRWRLAPPAGLGGGRWVDTVPTEGRS